MLKQKRGFFVQGNSMTTRTAEFQSAMASFTEFDNTDATIKQAPPSLLEIPHEVKIRLLYTNPVCLLTTFDPLTRERNIMTISWVTPLSNRAAFLASMNTRRYSTTLLQRTRRFVLSIPTKDDIPMVLAIGRCTGAKISDKIGHLNVPVWHPFGTEVAPAVLGGCCAFLSCVVEHLEEVDGHFILRCRIERALVHDAYWNGKHFVAKKEKAVAPYLTFLGGGEFAFVEK